jgi:uncharacterized protein
MNELLSGLAYDQLTVLFIVSIVAGAIDSLVGGGGLLTIPALLSCGVPPVAVLGTNKLQATFGSLSAARQYYRQGQWSFVEIKNSIGWVIGGALIGAWLSLKTAPELIRGLILVALFIALIYSIIAPKFGDIENEKKLAPIFFNIGVGFSLGFYDGYLGPGTGSFWILAWVSLQGYRLKKAMAHGRVMNAMSNIGALVVFLIGGQVLIVVGILMGLGQWLGAKVATKIGMMLSLNHLRILLRFVVLMALSREVATYYLR